MAESGQPIRSEQAGRAQARFGRLEKPASRRFDGVTRGSPEVDRCGELDEHIPFPGVEAERGGSRGRQVAEGHGSLAATVTEEEHELRGVIGEAKIYLRLVA